MSLVNKAIIVTGAQIVAGLISPTAFGMMLHSLTSKHLDPLVGLALVSALEGLTMELLTSNVTDDAVERASSVMLGLIALVAEHPERVGGVASPDVALRRGR